MNELDKLIEYYVNLLIIQYHNKPKARATIRTFIAQLIDAYKLLREVEQAFEIDKAVGNQLDIVGKYFGVVRNFVGLQFGYEYFSFQYEGGDDNGLSFKIIGDDASGLFRTLYGENTYQYDLDDNQFRTLIKLRDIALHNEQLSYKYIIELGHKLLGNEVYIVPSTDMSIDYYFRDENLLQVFQTYDKLLPSPAGVGVNVYRMGDFDVKFALIVLPANGGTPYNVHQYGLQNLNYRFAGKWKVLPENEYEEA